jgi:hypothetical protein
VLIARTISSLASAVEALAPTPLRPSVRRTSTGRRENRGLRSAQ